MAGAEIHGWLVLRSGKAQGDRYPIADDEFKIGRGSTCQVQLDDPKASRRHALITVQNDQLQIEDLGSTHGILVNGRKVSRTMLKNGDLIRLGDTQFEVELSPDSIGTFMAPARGPALPEGTCRFCSSPLHPGEAYCGTCGAITRGLPEPFEFIQRAYLQLRALHQSGKIDAETFRTELEKMIIADGSERYWMVGVQSGRWHWFNGKEWFPREPPTKSLRPSPIKAAPPEPPQAAPIPPAPGFSEPDEGSRVGRFFIILGGALIAFSILAVGAYAASRFVNPDGQLLTNEVSGQFAPIDNQFQAAATDTEVVGQAINTATFAPTATLTPEPSKTPVSPFSFRAFDPETDQNLVDLADFTSYDEASSGAQYDIYEGSWEVGQPAFFNIGWCAIDRQTLEQNLQVMSMSLEVDGAPVQLHQMYEQNFEDEDIACRSFRTVVQFHEPGEHRLLWTTSYTEPVFDGWQTLEAGTYLNEYRYAVMDVISVEDEFESSSGNWDETEQQNFSQWTEGGSFHIQVHKGNFAAWSIYHDLEIGDTLILAHAKRLNESGGSYGLIFHYQDVSNFYYFMVDDSGHFQIGKRLAGDWVELIDWTPTDSILAGEFNRLGITTDGDEITAFINGELAGTVTDESFASGGAGLIAQSATDQAEMHAEFDVFYLEYYP